MHFIVSIFVAITITSDRSVQYLILMPIVKPIVNLIADL